MKFTITYSITTPESAEAGDHEEVCGFGEVGEFSDLREALHAFGDLATSADIYPVGPGCDIRWITNTAFGDYTIDHITTGREESRCLHFPPECSIASRLRIARLAGLDVGE